MRPIFGMKLRMGDGFSKRLSLPSILGETTGVAVRSLSRAKPKDLDFAVAPCCFSTKGYPIHAINYGYDRTWRPSSVDACSGTLIWYGRDMFQALPFLFQRHVVSFVCVLFLIHTSSSCKPVGALVQSLING